MSLSLPLGEYRRFLVAYLRRRTLTVFVLYRIALGLLILWLLR